MTRRLDRLENESVFVIREARARFENPALLWSIGKDSTTLLWLCRKAFFGTVPFPVVHIDTTYKFPEMYAFRDEWARRWGLDLRIARNDEALARGVSYATHDAMTCCDELKTRALKQTIAREGHDALLVGIRRDEHGVRAKERFFSPRDDGFRWNYEDQPAELWDHFHTGRDERDRCGFDEDRFRALAAGMRNLLAAVGSEPFATVPISAREGDKVVHRSARTPWYAGPTILNVPSTYPAPARIRGLLVSGLVAVDLGRATSPRSFVPVLEGHGYRVDVRARLGHEDLDAFLRDLHATLGARQRTWRDLWSRDEWDLFFHVITGTDRLLHFLHAAFEDELHPHHDAFRGYFRRVDECVGEIRVAHRAAGGGPLFMMSDHGFGPLRHEVMTNRVLEELGYFSADPTPEPGLEGIHDTAHAVAMDPARIYLHDERYPRGPVRAGERAALREEIAATLAAYEVGGERPVARVARSEEIYEGPAAPAGPDLVLIGAEGWDFKARLDPGPTVRRSVFTGKHTRDDAFFLAAGEHELPVVWPDDVTGVRAALGAGLCDELVATG